MHVLAQVMLPTLAAACYGDERLCSLMAATVAPKHVALALGQQQPPAQLGEHPADAHTSSAAQADVEGKLQHGSSGLQQQQQPIAADVPLPRRYMLESRFPLLVIAQVSG